MDFSSKKFILLNHPGMRIFLFIFLLFIVRIFCRGDILFLDEAEQAIMAQKLSIGYLSQPPLYTWLQFLFFKVFGLNLFSIALLKYSLLLLCVYIFFQIAKIHSQDELLAWCATLSWALIPAISFDLIKDNTHSVLVLLASLTTWYWFIRSTVCSKWIWYSLFGVILGLGLLTKFNYLPFLFLFLISCLLTPEAKNKITNPFIFLTLFVASLVASSYIQWVFVHPEIGLANAYKLKLNVTSHFSFLQLLKVSVFFILPFFLFVFSFFPLSLKKTPQDLPGYQLLRTYHLLLVPLLSLAGIFGGLGNIEARWLIPLLSLCPIFYFTHVPRFQFEQRKKRYIQLCLVIQLIFIMVLVWTAQNDSNQEKRFFIHSLVSYFNDLNKAPEYVVSDSHWILGNLLLKTSCSKTWLIYEGHYFKQLTNHSLLIWKSQTNPPWLNNLHDRYKLLEMKEFTNNKNRQVGGWVHFASR